MKWNNSFDIVSVIWELFVFKEVMFDVDIFEGRLDVEDEAKEDELAVDCFLNELSGLAYELWAWANRGWLPIAWPFIFKSNNKLIIYLIFIISGVVYVYDLWRSYAYF